MQRVWTPYHGDGENLPVTWSPPPSAAPDHWRVPKPRPLGGSAVSPAHADLLVPYPRSCRPLASPTTLVVSAALCVTSVWMAFPSPWTWRTTSTVLETTTRESPLLRKQCGPQRGLPSSLSCLPLPLWSWPFFLFLPSCFLCSWGRDSSDFGDRSRKMGLLIFW